MHQCVQFLENPGCVTRVEPAGGIDWADDRQPDLSAMIVSGEHAVDLLLLRVGVIVPAYGRAADENQTTGKRGL